MNELSAETIYRRRFKDSLAFRDEMWQILCKNYFQKFVPTDGTVLEIAAGYCEFINNIVAQRKIAVDINKDTINRAHSDVQVITTSSTDLSAIPGESIDIIFVSNFFEHITKDDITRTVEEGYRCLKNGGKILILQPNIRYTFKDYWMFYDHVTPIDDRALCELLEVIGFKIDFLLPRFLPYSTKSRLPNSTLLLRIYLRIPLLYKIFGGQAFVVAEK